MEPISGMFGIPRTLFGKIGNNRLRFDVVVFLVGFFCGCIMMCMFFPRFVDAQRWVIAAADSRIAAAAVDVSEVGTRMI